MFTRNAQQSRRGRNTWRLLLALALVAAPQLMRAQEQAPPPDQLDVQIFGAADSELPAAPEAEQRIELTAEDAGVAEPVGDLPPHSEEVEAGAHGEPALIEEAGAHGEEAGHGDEHGGGGGHADPVTPVLLDLALILVFAKLGGGLFGMFRQPAVLGELVFGVLLGNLLLPFGLTHGEIAGGGGFFGWYSSFSTSVLTPGSPIDQLARIGVILLLFLVGLESNIADMMKVGLSSLLVAVLGVIAPFFLGMGVSMWLLPGEHPIMVHVFIGATLCATSVGITARVLRELGKLNKPESRIVLGAAVIDDVLGLVILAVVAGVISAQSTGGEFAISSMFVILGKAIGFLLIAVLGGQWLSPRLFGVASKLRGQGVLLVTALIVCFLLAAAANLIGLAPIVGAFAAGLLLDPVHYRQFTDRGEHHIEELIEPIAAFLVPIFFVQMGMTVDLSTFGNTQVLGFAAMLTLVAIIGKQVCSFGVLGKGLDRWSVGIGMIPRGEVGLIFAAIGQGLMLAGEPVIGPNANAAVVIMVIVTTMVTPPVLAWSLKRGEARNGSEDLDHEMSVEDGPAHDLPPHVQTAKAEDQPPGTGGPTGEDVVGREGDDREE